MENLTKKEIDALVDALEAWEQKDFGSSLMMGLMGAMFTKDDPEAQEKFKREEEKRRAEEEIKLRERKETSLMIKAKLVRMKQDMLIDDTNKILQH